MPYRFCRIGSFQPCDCAEGVEQFDGFRRPGIALEVRPKFLEGKLMHVGMLADVKRVQVEAESANLPQQGTDGSCQTVSTVGVQAVLHQHEVALKFFSISVGRWAVLRIAAALKFVKHVGKKAAITFCRIVRPPGEVHSGNRAFVVLQAREQFFRDSGLAARRTKPVTEGFNIMEIFAKDQNARHLQRAANAVWGDQRVAVPVSANPRSKLDEVGQGVFVECEAVDVAEGFHDLGIDLGKRVEQREPKVAQAHANFVCHGGLCQAHFVGLPE